MWLLFFCIAFFARFSRYFADTFDSFILLCFKPLTREVIKASPKNPPIPSQKILSIKRVVGLPIWSVTSSMFFFVWKVTIWIIQFGWFVVSIPFKVCKKKPSKIEGCETERSPSPSNSKNSTRWIHIKQADNSRYGSIFLFF